MKLNEKAALIIENIGFAKVRVLLLLVTITICAYFLAKGSTRLIVLSSTALSGYPAKVSAQSEHLENNFLPGSESPNPNEILQRNIFDSQTGPLWPAPAPEDLESEEKPLEEIPVPGPDDPPSECAKELFLAAAAYFPSDPNRSMIALVGPNELDAQPLYRQGTQIGDFELVAIYPNMAYLKRPSGDYCSLKLYSEKRRKKIERERKKREKAKRHKKKKNAKKRK